MANKILFFTPGNIYSQFQECELELAQKHIDQGDDVIFYNCKGDLPTCWVNTNHSYAQCLYCKSKRNNGFELLNGKFEVQNFYLLTNSQKKFIQNFSINVADHEELKTVYIDNFDLGWTLLSSLVSLLRHPYPPVKEHIEKINKWAKESLILYYSMQNQIKKCKFDYVYIANGRTVDFRPILRACQNNHIPCATFNTGSTIEKYMLFPNNFIHDIDATTVLIEKLWEQTDPIERNKIASQYYENRFKGITNLYKVYVDKQNVSQLPDNWNPRKKNISIFNSSEDEMVAIGPVWQNPIYQNQLEGIRQLIKSASDFGEDYHFYLRLHPNLFNAPYEFMKDIIDTNLPNFTVIMPESPVSTYFLAKNSNKVIGYASTVTMEAAYMGIPAILAGKTLFYYLGSTYKPKSHAELLEMIKKDLLPLENTGALKYALWLSEFGYHYKNVVVSENSTTYNGTVIKGNFVLESLKKYKKIK